MTDQILFVPLADIEVPETWNARSGAWHENPADLASDDGGYEGLKASLAVKNVNDTPVLLRSHPNVIARERRECPKYILVDGFRRMRAARELNWMTIRAVVEEMTDFEARRRNIQAQTSHERLKPADLAWAVADLKRLGGPKLTDAELGTLVGISSVYAGNLRRIMTDVDEKVTTAWRTSAVRVDVAELQRLTVLPAERHWEKWEEILLDKQTRPHGSSKATALVRLKAKCREKGKEIGVLMAAGVFPTYRPLEAADWTKAIRALFHVPSTVTPKELDELAQAMDEGFSEKKGDT